MVRKNVPPPEQWKGMPRDGGFAWGTPARNQPVDPVQSLVARFVRAAMRGQPTPDLEAGLREAGRGDLVLIQFSPGPGSGLRVALHASDGVYNTTVPGSYSPRQVTAATNALPRQYRG